MKGKTINQAIQALNERVDNLESGKGRGQKAIEQVAKAAAAGRDAVATELMVKTAGNAQEAQANLKNRGNDGAGL
jgi:prefoldin subunit 5